MDATEEVQAAAPAWYRAQLAPLLIKRAHADAAEVRVGRTVRSLTKRGKDVGLTGEVRWMGVDQYRSNRHRTEYRVGIKVDGEDRLRFMPADRVEVVDPDPVDEDAIRAQAAAAKPANWLSALELPLLLLR